MQEMSKILYDRALSYLNVDIAVAGHDHIRVKATPLLYSALYAATKMVYMHCLLCINILEYIVKMIFYMPLITDDHHADNYIATYTCIVYNLT